MNHLRHEKLINNKQLNNTRVIKLKKIPLRIKKRFSANMKWINLKKRTIKE